MIAVYKAMPHHGECRCCDKPSEYIVEIGMDSSRMLHTHITQLCAKHTRQLKQTLPVLKGGL